MEIGMPDVKALANLYKSWTDNLLFSDMKTFLLKLLQNTLAPTQLALARARQSVDT